MTGVSKKAKYISVVLEEELEFILKNRLKEILNERKMSQKELAKLTGLRENTISEIVKNVRDAVNREHIGKIATVLNIKNPNEIFYFEEK